MNYEIFSNSFLVKGKIEKMFFFFILPCMYKCKVTCFTLDIDVLALPDSGADFLPSMMLQLLYCYIYTFWYHNCFGYPCLLSLYKAAKVHYTRALTSYVTSVWSLK